MKMVSANFGKFTEVKTFVNWVTNCNPVWLCTKSNYLIEYNFPTSMCYYRLELRLSALYIKAMRVRTKDCNKCHEPKAVLYRCRYQQLKDWAFLCGKCLQKVKTAHENTYQYGGTWKSKKK